MALIATGSNKDYEPTPCGVQQAVCAFVEDIGTQAGTYDGKPTFKHQIVVCWELGAKMKKGDYAGRPFMVSKFYTLSLGEKANLRHDLESWRGRQFTEQELNGFDVEKLKGVNCLLNIVEAKKRDGSDTQKIAAIMPVQKGTQPMSPINTTPPEWIAKKRAQSVEIAQQDGSAHSDFGDTPPPQNEDSDPPIPF
jgi:hypothetical protein